MPLFCYSWQQAFVSPFVPSDDGIVASFLQVFLPSPPLPLPPTSSLVCT